MDVNTGYCQVCVRTYPSSSGDSGRKWTARKDACVHLRVTHTHTHTPAATPAFFIDHYFPAERISVSERRSDFRGGEVHAACCDAPPVAGLRGLIVLRHAARGRLTRRLTAWDGASFKTPPMPRWTWQPGCRAAAFVSKSLHQEVSRTTEIITIIVWICGTSTFNKGFIFFTRGLIIRKKILLQLI